ncbi:MAG: hypothetical protein PHZ01_05725, partial [Bacteroidales bacterium]|nr:hypothetical protein [Bacteroidales bacterium]
NAKLFFFCRGVPLLSYPQQLLTPQDREAFVSCRGDPRSSYPQQSLTPQDREAFFLAEASLILW